MNILERTAKNTSKSTVMKRARTALITFGLIVLLASLFGWQAHRRIEQNILGRYLCSAVKAGDVVRVKGLLARGADPNAREVPPPPPSTNWERIRRLFHPPAPDESSMAALHRAVYDAKAEIVEDLLRHGADPNARWSGEFWYSNQTPLNMVGGDDCGRIVQGLLDAGADPNAACNDDINHHPFPALYRALEGCDTETVRLMLARGAKLDANPGIEWALEAAAFNTDPGPMKLLLEMGYDANSQPGGISILSTASGYGNLEVVKTIVAHGGLINVKNQKDGKTPLGSAIEIAKIMNPNHPQGKGAREVAAYLRSIGGR